MMVQNKRDAEEKNTHSLLPDPLFQFVSSPTTSDPVVFLPRCCKEYTGGLVRSNGYNKKVGESGKKREQMRKGKSPIIQDNAICNSDGDTCLAHKCQILGLCLEKRAKLRLPCSHAVRRLYISINHAVVIFFLPSLYHP